MLYIKKIKPTFKTINFFCMVTFMIFPPDYCNAKITEGKKNTSDLNLIYRKIKYSITILRITIENNWKYKRRIWRENMHCQGSFAIYPAVNASVSKKQPLHVQTYSKMRSITV
ncbi:DNA-directed RNA polymerase subunit beta' [Labeo rohita]|uniref:DNA-directed RNA polymerase subunit beta n=1 Tax=Labeo rohita TaxID=84645 RepID=A0ABQ8N0J2_LABRO|nr:DNA-directed RNA polymerase subunit beta' [Labeo rohita]